MVQDSCLRSGCNSAEDFCSNNLWDTSFILSTSFSIHEISGCLVSIQMLNKFNETHAGFIKIQRFYKTRSWKEKNEIIKFKVATTVFLFNFEHIMF